MKKIIVIIGILFVLITSGCETRIGSRCSATNDCSEIKCKCPAIEGAYCEPRCINKECECVIIKNKYNEEYKYECARIGGIWKTFPTTCVDSCDFVRGKISGCGEALTDGCDCGQNRCWNGISCEPN